ncbi:MAG: lipoprotein [Arenicellales bacterium]
MRKLSILTLSIIITSVFFLSACGQKGALYLPETEKQADKTTSPMEKQLEKSTEKKPKPAA